MNLKAIGAMLAAMIAQTAAAQDDFTGMHVGLAATAVDHHFVVEEQQLPAGVTRQFNVTRWGVGGQVFAGYDLAVAPRALIGVEGSFDFGGREAAERNAYYALGISPKHGFAVTARAGILPTPRFMLYAGAGFGGHDYRVTDTNPSAGGDDLSYNRSFVLRGGGEYRLMRHVGVRVEFEHLDGTRNSFIVGVPIRF